MSGANTTTIAGPAAAIPAGRLAELVYALRTQAGLTQTELAKRMGTTQP